MVYAVVFRPAAMRELEKLADYDADRILRAVETLQDDPRPSQSRKLRGAKDLYRLRVGDFRAVYRIEDKRVTVTVLKIGHRRDVYRK